MKKKYVVIALGLLVILAVLIFIIKRNMLKHEVVNMKMNENEFFEALYSAGFNSELNKGEDLFGQFVGNWEFEWFNRDTNDFVKYEKGEWIFSWILEGRVIQDVWIIPGRDRRYKQGLPKGEFGTTLRFYNIKSKVWNVVWIGPVNGNLNTFEARKTGDEIVLEETNRKSGMQRWIFSEISSNKFHWRAIKSDDGGKNWKLTEEMNVIRKNYKN
jgi:hypothetical protein